MTYAIILIYLVVCDKKQLFACASSLRSDQKVSEVVNFKIFLGGGGACPQTPLGWVCYHMLDFLPSTKKSYIIVPVTDYSLFIAAAHVSKTAVHYACAGCCMIVSDIMLSVLATLVFLHYNL